MKKKKAINEAFFNLAKMGKLDANNIRHRQLTMQVLGSSVPNGFKGGTIKERRSQAIAISQGTFDQINKVFSTDYIKDAKTNIIKTAAELQQERLTAEGYINA